jgi:P-type E1-E2 ATPase
VIASNSTTYAAVVYTGSQTRQALSTSQSRSKVGLLEYEINGLTKILCILTLALSGILVMLERLDTKSSLKWYIAMPRFIILFSTIIPISLRVNLDLGKSVYSRFIEKDAELDGAIVRTSTIPEELGRIEYLLTDKTGTLTQNGKHEGSSLNKKEVEAHALSRINSEDFFFRDGAEENPCRDCVVCERRHGRSGSTRAAGFWRPGCR